MQSTCAHTQMGLLGSCCIQKEQYSTSTYAAYSEGCTSAPPQGRVLRPVHSHRQPLSTRFLNILCR